MKIKYIHLCHVDLNYSLYDINNNKFFIHYEDIELEYQKQWYIDWFNCSNQYLQWKKENIHNEIIKIIQKNNIRNI